ncbi:hypothetical protein BGZ80_011595 [Entomortierella chlamydospora]|uniref:Peptidase S9 prolyl oligopeptidase catalytic domain-containing protein n=1 Tax=Entomortierella chlamydospora TaxID=101097 RepID=A0A9P6MU81_9FUNG|nr:hypothetical protein BGZ80_011595 [Entomortierella chlamydospora]
MVQVAKEGFGGYTLMDAVDDTLAGEFISVTLRNVGPQSVIVKSVRTGLGSREFSVSLDSSSGPIKLFPSIHRPIAIQLRRAEERSLDLSFSLIFELETIDQHSHAVESTETLETKLIRIEQRKWGEAYMYTFKDFDGTVHHAAAIPPSDPSSQPAGTAPVLVLMFHKLRFGYQNTSNENELGGYDWHGASIKNVLNAIQSLADNLPGVPKALRGIPGIKPDPERLFMAGHSNGGQGAWYLVTHFPDRAIAATPAAGYVNIKQYVPFIGWISSSYTDSYLRGLLESSIIEFDNDVHMSNAVGIPILARAGSADDNVPPFNSRKMVRLGQENAHNLSAVSLSEIPDREHWFTGILHDDIMQNFLKQHLLDDVSSGIEGFLKSHSEVAPVAHPPFPRVFEISVINPAGMESRGGIQVEQLSIPFRKGSVKVEIVEDRLNGISTTWVINTTNIRRFRFLDSPSLRLRRGLITNIVIDGVAFKVNGDEKRLSELSLGTFLRQNTSKGRAQWQFSSSDNWALTERHRETYGPAIQILEKRVIVVLGTKFASHLPELSHAADRIAKLVAHDIYLYGRGDVEVVTDDEYLARIAMEAGNNNSDRSNLVLIGGHHQNSVTKHVLATAKSEVTIDSQDGQVSIHPNAEIATPIEFRKPGTGLLMIRPWGPSNLAMVIAGLDARGLETAARLFPKRTGLLVPDWVMKAFKTLFVVGLTCLQLLSGSQAQSATATTNATTTTAVAGSSTTSTTASAATPTVYANTPGLTVSLFDQMAVVENTVLSMSISLSGQRTIGKQLLALMKNLSME